MESRAASSTRVGRPSLMVSPREDVISFAVQLALDTTTVGVVNLSGKVVAKESRQNPPNVSAREAAKIANDSITQLRSKLPRKTRIIGVGVAIPGQIRVAEGIVQFAPAFKWVEVPFGPMLSDLCHLPVFIDNDASLGCLAERTYGIARGYTDIVYLFAGPNGIGGGVVVDGQQLRGAAGYAGELGHLRISDSPHKDYSGLSGTLEALIRRDELLQVLNLEDANQEKLEQAILNANQPEQMRMIEGQIDILAVGIANFVNVFNPQLIILAGFLGSLFTYDSLRLIKKFRKHALTASREHVVVHAGELGTELLMIGAAELPIHHLVKNPSGISSLRPQKKG
jgi:predicted NBD/HSP70 family sugar kinase